MGESSDLLRVADLLALHGRGTFVVNAVGAEPWLTARFLRRTLPALEYLLWEREPTITAVPLAKAGSYLARVPSSVLWARTDSGKQATALRNFRPMPQLVLREGGSARYVAFWALEDPLPDRDWLEKANKRLAHRLGTPKKWADDGFTFHLPGAVVRHRLKPNGETVPCKPYPVELVRFEPAVLAAREVVGRLRDAPEPWKPDWLRERESAAALWR